MQIKEIITILNDQGMRIVAPVTDPTVRRIDGEFLIDNQVFTFRAYTIIGTEKTIRIDIKEKEPF
jgi:hypothetical protein